MARVAAGSKVIRDWGLFLLVGTSVFLLCVVGSAQQPLPQPPTSGVQPTPPPGTQPIPPGVPTATPAAHPLDQPIAWLGEARRNYTAVKDYTCTMIKRERVRGVLQDENIISLTCKAQPFSIYMKWLGPAKFRGQEVCYVEGRNNGMMRVKSKGIIGGITDFINIAPNDRRVMDHSRHTIHEAGIGKLIEQSSQIMDAERRLNKTQVRTGEFAFNNRRCLRVELARTERNDQIYCYRSLLYLDKDSKLPVRMENYDWPVSGGNPDGELLETFSYVDLRFNSGVPDEFFIK